MNWNNVISLTWSWHCNDFRVILKHFMILGMNYPKFIIEGFFNSLRIFLLKLENACMSIYEWKAKSSLIRDFWFTTIPKFLAILFFHKTCGVAWTIAWYKSFSLAHFWPELYHGVSSHCQHEKKIITVIIFFPVWFTC